MVLLLAEASQDWWQVVVLAGVPVLTGLFYLIYSSINKINGVVTDLRLDMREVKTRLGLKNRDLGKRYAEPEDEP